MPKFGNPDPQGEPVKVPVDMDQLDPATKGAGSRPDFAGRFSSSPSSAPQLSEAAQLAKIELEKQQWEKENAKQDEHWMKAYWRPAMGWLYMLICFCDFVAFPILAMFLPTIIKTQYIAWKSITLDNGGLIHLAFGAILGITSWTRGQEKIADKK